MAFKRMKPARPAASAPIDTQLAAELRRAVELKERGRTNEARAIAENLRRRYPKRKEPLLLLMDLAVKDEDSVAFEDALEPLLKLAPDNPEFVLAHARAAASNELMALTMERFNRFLERWPQHQEAPTIRKTMPAFKEELGKVLDKAGIRHTNRFELAARSDEIQLLILRQRFEEAQNLARHVLDREPTYLPILNNMAMLLMLDGKWRESLPYSERVVEMAPENVYALANLAQGNYVLGYKEEAALYAKRMKAGNTGIADKTGKVIETLSYLGDNEGALDAYRQAEGKDEPALESPLTHHLAGAAAMRLGQVDEARRCWTRALKIDPEFDITKENQADQKLPLGERNGPWAFSIRYWVPPETLVELAKHILEQTPSGGGDVAKKALRATLERHPYLETLVPILLERGDPPGRDFALFVAKKTQSPAMLEALRDFALSPNGPDSMRIEAANIVSGAGLFESETVRLWVRGEQQDVTLMGWEIYTEAEGSHRPAVEKLLEDASTAIYGGDGACAEKLLKEALEIEPDAPDIMNNLANALKFQSRSAEATDLMTDIFERFPDYFFGRINMIQLSLDDGRLDDAERLLTPLISMKRFHVSEFAALAQSQIEFLLRKHEPDAARHWYSMWKQSVPGHPGLERYRRKFDSAVSGLVKRIGRRVRAD